MRLTVLLDAAFLRGRLKKLVLHRVSFSSDRACALRLSITPPKIEPFFLMTDLCSTKRLTDAKLLHGVLNDRASILAI